MSVFYTHSIVTEDGISVVIMDKGFSGINFESHLQKIDTEVRMDSNIDSQSLIGKIALWPFESPAGVIAFNRESMDDFDALMWSEIGVELDEDFDYTFILIMPMVEVPADSFEGQV